MCIAALVLPGGHVNPETMRRMFNSNQDGAGVAYVRTSHGKNDVVVEKGYFDSEDWIAAYERAKTWASEGSPILLHARIATLGRVDRANCHPFRIKDGAMVHNGSLWYANGGYGLSCEKSDTREFAERCTNNFNYDDMVFDKAKLESVIGHNRMAFLFKDKRYIILNEKSGTWKDNVWYSNQHFVNSSSAICKSRSCRGS